MRSSSLVTTSRQARLLFSALAYTLVDYIRKKGLSDTELASARCDTIRLKLFKSKGFCKIGAVVIANTRKIVFRMPTSFTLKDACTLAVAKLSLTRGTAIGFG